MSKETWSSLHHDQRAGDMPRGDRLGLVPARPFGVERHALRRVCSEPMMFANVMGEPGRVTFDAAAPWLPSAIRHDTPAVERIALDRATRRPGAKSCQIIRVHVGACR